MRSPLFRALLTAALSTFLVAQEPSAADSKKLRQEANAAVQAGDFDAAAAAFRKLTEANPKDAQAWHMLGYSLHAKGKLDEALAVHLKAAEFPQTAGVATYNAACVYALKGKADEAFAWLDKAVAAGFADLDQLQGDADFDSIRKDPRMAKLETALKGGGGAQVFAGSVERKNTRAAWFSRKGSPGQLSIDYSPVPWSAKYEEVVKSGQFQGKKWRLGSDFWTRLDTSLDLKFGEVAVPSGYYYLTLEQRDAETYVLALHDAAAVKKQKLDAFMSDRLQGGIEIKMMHKATDDVAKQLAIEIEMKPGSKTEGLISLRFGGHALAAPFTAKIE